MAGQRRERALNEGRERVLELCLTVARRDRERVSQLLFEAGAGAVEERDGGKLVVYVTSETEARRLTRATGGAPSSLRELDPSWQTEWMRWLGPVALTERTVLQPTTDRSALSRGMRRLWYEPEQAFGVGSHATTRLAARATERLCRGKRVLDVGTGNGVLALLAAQAGAERALGIDVDEVAVRAARKNARLNQLGHRCAFSSRPLERVRGRFDLVVANIEVWVLLELCPELCRVSADRLVLSGLLCDRDAEVLGAFGRFGLCELSRAEEEGWLGLELGRQNA